MARYSITTDGTQRPFPEGRRLIASASGVLILPPAIAFGVLALRWDLPQAASGATVVLSIVSIALAAVQAVRAARLAESRDRMVRL